MLLCVDFDLSHAAAHLISFYAYNMRDIKNIMLTYSYKIYMHSYKYIPL